MVMSACGLVAAGLLVAWVGLFAACATTGGAGVTPDAPSNSEGDDSIPATTAGYLPGRPGIPARRATAHAEIGEARRAMEAAGSDCTEACPAIAQLRVGVAHTCDISSGKDDAKACREAKGRLQKAETELRSRCGECKPPSEPDASDDIAP
jgi:hypothetical protein